jgi:hypothetical protein
MRYRTVADNIGLAVDTDSNPATMTLTDERSGETVTVTESQVGLIKLIRRGMADIFDAGRVRERMGGWQERNK